MLLSRQMTPAAPCEAGKMFMRHCVDLVGDISQLAELSSGSITNDANPNPINNDFVLELVK
jgi:hypothetical protein